ncbi:exodeoxyribonuclease VII large subunit [Roseateles sp. BYS78W]|uniref:Exodeoxyribonuclease VII large subunit n=1 Tax=Pelomonas candidula TaxID=3299025 RepID=A0ABW7HEV6_9BURK
MNYLKVPYREKDEAKSLGARWDRDASSWYVPTGVDITPFSKWLPASAASALAPSTSNSTDLAAPASTTELEVPKGISLSRLLAGVAAAVSAAYREGVWIRAEVMKVDARNQNVYLELSERTAEGDVTATGRGFIPARVANRILPEFQRATGATLGPGIKVLVRARPVFSARWGLSLEIDAIDASFTLGDLAARMREIRVRLQREGLFDANKQLPAPVDFELVLVTAPEEAAGLGDFRADADVLQRHGVCRFVYAHSRFQGDGSAAEILSAAQNGLAAIEDDHGRLPDAVVVIRGGGAVNDLAWLNDYALARWICECPVPVLSGIGHERDNTILDEVAHTRFDTPSKVIAGIRDRIVARTRAAIEAYESIMSTAERAVTERRQQSDRLVETVKSSAAAALHRARLESERLNTGIRAGVQGQLAQAKQRVPSLLSDVRSGASTAIAEARSGAERWFAVTGERARAAADQARVAAATHMGVVHDRSLLLVETARKAAVGLLREVMGQGPQRTLARGFALVRGVDGKPVTRIAGVAAGDTIEIELADGQLGAAVSEVKRGADERGES